MTTLRSVAVVGLGQMGRGIALRLIEAGFEVRVHNRTAARMEPLAARGAQACPSARAACEGADAVLAVVSDDAASRAIWLGQDGILKAALVPGALALECSTLSHAWVMELSAHVRRCGLRYLDTPVTGLPEMAATGRLTMLVGAESADLDAARPLLAAISERTIVFGAVGTGTAYKLIVNLLGAIQIASAAESMAIAERAGLDPATVADAIAAGQAGSPQVVRTCRRIVEGRHDEHVVFTPALRLKDVRYALEFARSLGIGSPFGAVAGRAFERLLDLGLRDFNETIVIEVARTQAADPPGAA